MKRAFAGAAILALLLSACATAPERSAPAWTMTTPAPDSSRTYFVGYSADPGGDLVKATDAATSNLVAEIMKYLGVRVTAESTATAKATLDSYAAQVLTTVKEESAGRLAGFAVRDKYVYRDPTTRQVFVYVLASYETADLDKEKRRIAALFQEQDDAVAKPEAQGKALLEAGRAFEAVQRFVEAAMAATGPGVDNAAVKVERNINNARAVLLRLHFIKAAEEYRASLGQPFAKPFRLRLVYGDGPEARGVAGAQLLVSWQRRQGTRTVAKTESATTDQDGYLSFTPPAPDFVGKARLVVRVDFQPAMDVLGRLPASFASYRGDLPGELASLSVDLPYEVVSNARNLATALAIVDLDESGQAQAGAAAQAGVAEALTKAGFSLPGLSLDPALVASGAEGAILGAAKASLGGRAERLAYGTARIVALRRDGQMYLADAQAQVRVVELSTGRLILGVDRQATGIGTDEASARRAAWRELGLNAIGAELLASLP
jgi:hypothetical protein